VAIGITADSFIVYFERVRDEAREGRSLRSAVESGWLRVRGFAFTLGLTTLVDLIVVFIFTKPVVTLIARMNFFASGHPLSGFSPKSVGLKSAKTNIPTTTVEA